jgi:hypothetical protein
MPQMIVDRPFKKLERTDQQRIEPPTLCHLLFSDFTYSIVVIPHHARAGARNIAQPSTSSQMMIKPTGMSVALLGRALRQALLT